LIRRTSTARSTLLKRALARDGVGGDGPVREAAPARPPAHRPRSARLDSANICNSGPCFVRLIQILAPADLALEDDGVRRSFSADARAVLAAHAWPGTFARCRIVALAIVLSD